MSHFRELFVKICLTLLVIQGTCVFGENDSTEDKKYHKAIEDLSNVIKLEPNNYIAYYNRGGAYFNTAQYTKAVDDFSNVIKLCPDDIITYDSRGKAYYYMQQYAKAIKDLSHYIKSNPNSSRAYELRGGAYYHLKQYDKAVADFSRAIKLEPDIARMYKNRGGAYFHAKQYDKAIEDYSRGIKLDPNIDYAYYYRGQAYYYLKQYENAIKDFSVLRDSNKYIGLAHVYCKQRQYDKAISKYSKALTFNQNDKVENSFRTILGYLNIMEICIITGKTNSFQSWLKKFETSIPENKLSKDHLVIKLYLTLINKCIINDSCTDTEKRLDELLKDNKDINPGWSFELTDEWLNSSKNGLTSEQIKYIEDLTKRIKAIQKS
jgi:tetratricopeptide (TPR) repeat protein